MVSRPRPFISYAHEDHAAATQLYGDLRAMGAQPWFDIVDLLPGQEWELAIRDALGSATHFVALISRRSVTKSGYVQKELRQALSALELFPPGHIFLIPVRLDPVEPLHDQLRKLQWVDLFEDRTAALEKIARSLGLAPTKAFQVGNGERAKNLARATRASRVEAASRWIGISVNDLMPQYRELLPRLAKAGIEPTYLLSSRGVKQPAPAYCVVVAHSNVGITMLRHVCAVVAPIGEWYVQIWDTGISENRIAIGAYGYGGSPAAPIDETLLANLKSRAFTMPKLKAWIATHGVVPEADYPPKE